MPIRQEKATNRFLAGPYQPAVLLSLRAWNTSCSSSGTAWLRFFSVAVCHSSQSATPAVAFHITFMQGQRWHRWAQRRHFSRLQVIKNGVVVPKDLLEVTMEAAALVRAALILR